MPVFCCSTRRSSCHWRQSVGPCATSAEPNWGQSLPQQHPQWADLKAAYRLLSNERIAPAALLAVHQQLVRQQMADAPVVLCVQDDTHLFLRPGHQVQHTSLAVLPDGTLLGVLEARWFAPMVPPAGETRLQRESRWRESCIWCDAVRAIGTHPHGGRLIHVCDRAADDLNMMEACVAAGSGFVIRARHDRRVERQEKLWSLLTAAAPAGQTVVSIGTQRDGSGKITRRGREASVTIRHAAVELQPPHNHPGAHQPRRLWAVYLREENPPDGVEPIDWMLLSSEPVNDLQDALRIVGYYRCRWIIEEWHLCLKQGCHLEQSQLDDAEDHRRLAAILSVVAVRMLNLRELAESDRCDDPRALQEQTPTIWIELVTTLAKLTDPMQLTPRQFWLTVARRGGWTGRKRDSRPGWKVIWRGWYDIHQMVRGAELWQQLHQPVQGCG